MNFQISNHKNYNMVFHEPSAVRQLLFLLLAYGACYNFLKLKNYPDK